VLAQPTIRSLGGLAARPFTGCLSQLTIIAGPHLGVAHVGSWPADQAGGARPDRRGSPFCAIEERRHPKGRSEAEQPAEPQAKLA